MRESSRGGTKVESLLHEDRVLLGMTDGLLHCVTSRTVHAIIAGETSIRPSVPKSTSETLRLSGPLFLRQLVTNRIDRFHGDKSIRSATCLETGRLACYHYWLLINYGLINTMPEV